MLSGYEFLLGVVAPILLALIHRFPLWREIRALLCIAVCAGIAYGLQIVEGQPVTLKVIYTTTPVIYGTATASYETLYRRLMGKK